MWMVCGGRVEDFGDSIPISASGTLNFFPILNFGGFSVVSAREVC
jgi:hypothetical protein